VANAVLGSLDGVAAVAEEARGVGGGDRVDEGGEHGVEGT
jgi:hypothetical protein